LNVSFVSNAGNSGVMMAAGWVQQTLGSLPSGWWHAAAPDSTVTVDRGMIATVDRKEDG
jgi:hypothetical protein